MMIKLFKNILIVITLVFSASMMGQTYTVGESVVGSLGGSFSGVSYTGDFTVGELVTSKLDGVLGDNIFTQGFHQGTVLFNDQDEKKIRSFEIKGYPNPVKDILNIAVHGGEFASLKLKIFNLAGRLIHEVEMNEPDITIDLSHLSQGTYFLHAIEQNTLKRVKTLKIQKL